MVSWQQSIPFAEITHCLAVNTAISTCQQLLLGVGHGPEADWWSCGVILYEFVTGAPPFCADSPEVSGCQDNAVASHCGHHNSYTLRCGRHHQRVDFGHVACLSSADTTSSQTLSAPA